MTNRESLQGLEGRKRANLGIDDGDEELWCRYRILRSGERKRFKGQVNFFTIHKNYKVH